MGVVGAEGRSSFVSPTISPGPGAYLLPGAIDPGTGKVGERDIQDLSKRVQIVVPDAVPDTDHVPNVGHQGYSEVSSSRVMWAGAGLDRIPMLDANCRPLLCSTYTCCASQSVYITLSCLSHLTPGVHPPVVLVAHYLVHY
jgi:hypothetical protein